MREAAANLEFEVAAILRDQLNDLKAASAPDVRRPTGKIRRRA
jgi:protein-arginine kinase activator protein McsA